MQQRSKLSDWTPLGAFVIGLAWLTYFIVFIIILYKSSVFFKELENKNEFQDIDTAAELSKLYFTAFIVQIIAAGLLFFIYLLWNKK